MGQTTLDTFFKPASIAVVGASPTPGKGGNALIRNIKQGFPGPIYPVNPNHRGWKICGVFQRSPTSTTRWILLFFSFRHLACQRHFVTVRRTG